MAPRRAVRQIELSDHRGYWDLDYPALMLTDTALLRNPHYHQPTDRLETLNLPAMGHLTRQITNAVRLLAGIRTEKV